MQPKFAMKTAVGRIYPFVLQIIFSSFLRCLSAPANSYAAKRAGEIIGNNFLSKFGLCSLRTVLLTNSSIWKTTFKRFLKM